MGQALPAVDAVLLLCLRPRLPRWPAVGAPQGDPRTSSCRAAPRTVPIPAGPMLTAPDRGCRTRQTKEVAVLRVCPFGYYRGRNSCGEDVAASPDQRQDE